MHSLANCALPVLFSFTSPIILLCEHRASFCSTNFISNSFLCSTISIKCSNLYNGKFCKVAPQKLRMQENNFIHTNCKESIYVLNKMLWTELPKRNTSSFHNSSQTHQLVDSCQLIGKDLRQILSLLQHRKDSSAKLYVAGTLYNI